jgi:hypothetical protein
MIEAQVSWCGIRYQVFRAVASLIAAAELSAAIENFLLRPPP